ncbi:MAG: DUF2332 family protein, partial [Proteobacteria bacterium]|nr:DUF2332 family protein [Pseudomonadota bacterium]
MDSPMYADLLRAALDDLRGSGATLDVVWDFEGDPTRQALALRFLGGVHRLVLAGRVPELAEFYPSVGGTPADGMEAAFLAAIADHPCELASAIKDAPQTNEVGRCGALLPGLANASSGKDLPVH